MIRTIHIRLDLQPLNDITIVLFQDPELVPEDLAEL